MIKIRSTFNDKSILNVENHLGIQCFEFNKENGILILFNDGTLKELLIFGTHFESIQNLRKSPNYFLLKKIDEVSFALLEPRALVIYN